MSIFSVPRSKLTAFDAGQGIDFMKKLLWAEAWRVGIPRQDVNISEEIIIADGGIDASVSTPNTNGSILIPGKTHYQIKTGAAFKPWQQAQIKKELFGKHPPKLGALGSQVRRGLEEGAAYSLVVLGHDLTSPQLSMAKDWLAEYFSQCGFSSVSIHVLGAGEIAGMLELHPSLCLEINGLGDVRFQSTSSWQANADMTPSLSLGIQQSEFIEELRATLDESDIKHVRVVGEPGIGKTRLVLEAVAGHEALAASTMYFKQASDFRDGKFLNELLRQDQSRSVILVVDECENQERSAIWVPLKTRPGVKLVTIDHGPDEAGGQQMKTLKAPSLEGAQIESILRSYLPGNELLHKWAAWCEGSARVAHALGENLRDNPGDIFRTPDTIPIWERFISGYGNEVEGGRAKTVLLHVALFEMFGYVRPVKEEADYISTLVNAADPSITRPRFNKIIQYYLDRRILQGDKTLRIVPKALRIYLWREWWKIFGASADIQEMLNSMPKSLHRWFMRPFIYAQDVTHALTGVKGLLDPSGGLFANKEVMLTESGAGFISVLAEAAPEDALNLLRSIIQWPESELKMLRNERHTLARALGIIAVWQPHFRTAVRVLARLAIGESSTYSNNCRGTLLGLFIPFHAPTQTPFIERTKIALELLAGATEFERKLGLEACTHCLKLRSGSRLIGVEFQGVRPEINFWHGAVLSDWTESWVTVIHELLKSRSSQDAGWNGLVDHALLEVIGDLLRGSFIVSECLETIEKLLDNRNNFQSIYTLLTNLIKYPPDGMKAKTSERVSQLRDRLDGVDFKSKLLRHVLSNIWDDDIDEVEDGGMEKRENRIKALAEEVAAKPELMRSVLADLFSGGATRLSQFGHFFAVAASDAALDREMAEYAHAHLEGSQYPFLGGYLSGVFASDPARWEALALTLLLHPVHWIILAVVDSGASGPVFDRLLQIHEHYQGKADWMSLLCRGSMQSLLGQDRMRQAISVVLNKGTDYDTAIQMAELVLCKNDDPFDIPIAYEVLIAGAGESLSVMPDHYWGVVSKRFLEKSPDKKIELLELLIQGANYYKGIATRGKIAKRTREICKEFPFETWPIVATALLKEESHGLRDWLGDDEIRGQAVLPAITLFSFADIFAWIDEAPLERAWKIAGVLPKTLTAEKGGDLTKKFLDRYLGVEGIGDEVMFRFGDGFFRGHRSEHLIYRRSEAQVWLSEDCTSATYDWIEVYVQKLSEQIEAAKISEERSIW